MDREQRVDRMDSNAPPDSEKPNVVNRALRAAGAKAPAAHTPWLRNLNAYVRRERREYEVARFG
jgi:hypothetical protein